jgi:AcrR family transcriptional regulator
VPNRVRTRDVVLARAARLFAERGYGGTTVTDIGTASGISGPALYKHFPSKYAVLQRLLVDISEQLAAGGRAVVDSAPDPPAAVAALVAFHVDFALAESDVIRVQDRDLGTLHEKDRRQVRRLQRRYAELWVDAVRQVDPALPDKVARMRVQSTFGLMNSTPYVAARSSLRGELIATALRALDATAPSLTS